jgi:thimet oligopeptidase
MKNIKIIIILLVALIFISYFAQDKKFSKILTKKNQNIMNKYCNLTESEKVKSIEDLANLFICNASDVKTTYEKCQQELERDLQNFFKTDNQNSFAAYDELYSNFIQTSSILQVLEMVSPDENVRNSCHEKNIKLKEIFNQKVAYNKDIYLKLVDAKIEPSLTYSYKSIIDEYNKNGINLSSEQREKVTKLINQINKLAAEYNYAINQDTPTVEVTTDELNNLKESVKNIIKDNKIILTPPNYMTVIQQANVESVRKKCWQAYLNKAPGNKTKLKEIIKLRDQLAKELNFANFATFDIHDQMAKNPETVKSFLDKLIKPLQDKANIEFECLKSSLPKDVVLVNDKFKPWDLKYVQEDYRQKYLNLDQEEISHYFETERTLKKLLNIYENFLNIKFKQIENKNLFWHPDVKILELYQNNQLTGYILLDLHPRECKYCHACQATIIPAYKNNLAAAVVIANFPKAEINKHSLLKYQDVVTFFHEFGHALHAMLGRTEIASKSGTNVALDFVEMPSQMLEEWLKEKNVLKDLGAHYITGQPLPDETIDALTNMEKANAGFNYSTQLFYALLSLKIHEVAEIDFLKLSQEIFTKIINKVEFVPNNLLNSFGHLTGYGSKYYGYLWAQVFALDIFETIKKNNFSTQIGQKYLDTILKPGGTEDPALLVKKFLGREQSQNAFLKSLGI